MVEFSRLVDFFEEIAPPFLSYDWDNSGPQVICDKKKIEKLVLGLDPAESLIDYATDEKADLVVTHHPLLFDSLEKIDLRGSVGGRIAKLLENRLNLFSIHTNFDRAIKGLSEGLASYLELNSTEPLLPVESAKFRKVVVYLPPEAEEELKRSIFEAGGGKGGLYEEVSFSSKGEGSFKPLEGARPHVGEKGEKEELEELRLEVRVPREKLHGVREAIETNHPYEKPAYDVFPTENVDSRVGLGRAGSWKKTRDLEEVKSLIGDRMDISDSEMDVYADPGEKFERVGVSPGSGGSVLGEVLSSQLDLFVTGELDYHERTALLDSDTAVIELGHRDSEKIFSPWLKGLISEKFSGDDLEVLLFEEAPVA